MRKEKSVARIAVVNDDTDFLTLMSELLEDRGWDVVTCREGKLAFAVLKQENPELVILDIRMNAPETGWNILEVLKLDPTTRHIPIIVCSAAWDELCTKEDWLKKHGIAILPKPFDIDDLYQAVEIALQQMKPPLERALEDVVRE
jgi:CheY-like chemotaxis protein